MTIRTLIADNEVSVRERIRSILLQDPSFSLIAECGNGLEASRMIRESDPDLVIIDVHMPGMNGLKVISKDYPSGRPVTIFMADDGEMALQAFELHAVDYLMKPLDPGRLEKALSRAQERLQQLSERKSVSKSGKESVPETCPRILVKSNGKVCLLKVSDIDWIEASGNYLRLHVGEKVHLVRETMNNMERQLGNDQFMRIHRSTIVNIDRIHEMQSWFHGEYEIHLQNGTRLMMSRGYRNKLQAITRR